MPPRGCPMVPPSTLEMIVCQGPERGQGAQKCSERSYETPASVFQIDPFSPSLSHFLFRSGRWPHLFHPPGEMAGSGFHRRSIGRGPLLVETAIQALRRPTSHTALRRDGNLPYPAGKKRVRRESFPQIVEPHGLSPWHLT
jgi:hypothetical protein